VEGDEGMERLGRVTRYAQYPYLPGSTAAWVETIIDAPYPLLIVGEVGCGREQVARAIHMLRGAVGPWISIFPSEVSDGSGFTRIEQRIQACATERRWTLFADGVDTLSLGEQVRLLRFMEDQEELGREWSVLSGCGRDPRAKVERGEFHEALYYRLARLALRIPPLRERQPDIPALAFRVAQDCACQLGLGPVHFTPGAMKRLCDYRWAGNLWELETVLARTVTLHRAALIGARDLVFEEEPAVQAPGEKLATQWSSSVGLEATGNQGVRMEGPLGDSGMGNGRLSSLGGLMGGLVHELKNPMVTIKTFAQLLNERFDNATFRTRFQEMVGFDIDRMDGVIGELMDFSQFGHPVMESVCLEDQLRSVFEDMVSESRARETSLFWVREGPARTQVRVDRAQIRYAFKSILLTAIDEIKPGCQIHVDVEGGGGVTLSYVRYSLSHYLFPPPEKIEEPALPLRILLAKSLLEWNGGNMEINHLDEGTVRIEVGLPSG